MAVKHISGSDGYAICGIKVRSGSDRWDSNGNTVYRGSVNDVKLVNVSHEAQLGMGGPFCLKCTRKWKNNNLKENGCLKN